MVNTHKPKELITFTISPTQSYIYSSFLDFPGMNYVIFSYRFVLGNCRWQYKSSSYRFSWLRRNIKSIQFWYLSVWSLCLCVVSWAIVMSCSATSAYTIFYLIGRMAAYLHKKIDNPGFLRKPRFSLRKPRFSDRKPGFSLKPRFSQENVGFLWKPGFSWEIS